MIRKPRVHFHIVTTPFVNIEDGSSCAVVQCKTARLKVFRTVVEKILLFFVVQPFLALCKIERVLFDVFAAN